MGIMPDRFNSTSAPDIGASTIVTSVVPSVPVTIGYVQTVDDPFLRELTQLINRYSKENGSHTADFQIARYLVRCLEVFDETVRFREAWYGRNPDQGPG